jgi:hypothetical protein
MKQEHKIIAAVAVLLVLGLGVYFTRNKSEKEGLQHEVTATKDLPPIKVSDEDAEKISKIVIKNADKGNVTLEKKGDKWELTEPLKAAANEQSVKSLIDNAKKLELTSVIAETADVHPKYDLTDEKAVHAELYKGKDKILDLYFGKGGGRGQMVRLPGKDTVYAAKGYSAFNWARETHNWREKEILKFEDKNATFVEVENEHGKFSFTRKDKPKDEKKDGDKKADGDKKKEAKDVPAKDEPEDEELDLEGDDDPTADKDKDKKEESEWDVAFYPRDEKTKKLSATTKKIDRFEGKKVDELLRAFKQLNATNFADEKAKTGLEDPIESGGGILRIKLKNKAEYELKVGKKQEGSNRYLVKEGDPTVFVVGSYAADWVMAKPEKFQKPEEKKDDDKDEDDDSGDDEGKDAPKKDKKEDKKSATKTESKPPAPAPKAPAPKAPSPSPAKK